MGTGEGVEAGGEASAVEACCGCGWWRSRAAPAELVGAGPSVLRARPLGALRTDSGALEHAGRADGERAAVGREDVLIARVEERAQLGQQLPDTRRQRAATLLPLGGWRVRRDVQTPRIEARWSLVALPTLSTTIAVPTTVPAAVPIAVPVPIPAPVPTIEAVTAAIAEAAAASETITAPVAVPTTIATTVAAEGRAAAAAAAAP